nr:lamin tail domain-containing protein [Agromyces seonyuensis]
MTAQAADASDVRITEWMYNPVNSSGEFIEFTNLGDAPVSLAGWSFDDDSRTPGAVALDGLGTLAAGQSVIITESADATFRSEWKLGADVKVLAGNTTNLGRADEINLFDGADPVANLVDRLAYGDNTVGGPRTQGVAGIPKTEAALGANDATQWQLSVAGDAEGTWASTAGDLGSPGTSRFAPEGEPTPSWAAVRINEISSDNGNTPVGDAIELVNTGDVDVDLTGWLQIDSGDLSAAKTFATKLADGTATTVVPAHGYVYFSSTKGLGSGGDGVKVYLADGTLVDSAAYTAGEAGSDESNEFGAGAFARCGDGTGAFASVALKSFGASNATACENILTNPGEEPTPSLDCQPEAASGTGALPAGALAWPGSADVGVADAVCAWKTTTGPEGRDISGLVFDPTDANVLYAVKNKSWVYRLVQQDGLWVADTANDWAAGKQIFFPGSTDSATNQPDSEGLTVGPDGALYITSERNNAANDIPLNSILRIDPTQPGTRLVATAQWNLTAEFPELHAGNKTEANLGFEGVAFVPDSYLTANGFVDQSTGTTYRPADYPLHGTGLYFAALENDGKLYAYALDSDGSFHRVSVVDSGMGHAMEVQFDADAQRIWAVCDNTCGVAATVLKVDATGAIVPEPVYAKPAGLPVNNFEGFAIAPNSTCVDGTKTVVWGDDGIAGTGAGSATEGHALYTSRIDCDLHLGEQGVPKPDTTRPLVTFVTPTTAGPFQQLQVRVDATDEVGLKRIVANVYDAAGTLVKSTQSAVANGATSGTHSATVTLPTGAYFVKYNAQDLAGNISTTGRFEFTIDATKPTATIKDGAGFTVKTGEAYGLISFKLYDAQKIDKVTINGKVKDLTDNQWSDVNFIKPGVFGAVAGANTLVVYDLAGNASTYEFNLG